MLLLSASGWLRWRKRVPVTLHVQRAVTFDDQHVTGGDLLNVAKERSWRRCGEERQVVIERLFVDVGRYGRMLQDRLDLGRENEAALLVIEVQRFDADAIADENELFFVRVPERDAVIAFDVVNEVETAFFVQVQDGFGVSA